MVNSILYKRNGTQIFTLALTVSEILRFAIFDNENLGRGHKVQISRWSHSTAIITVYKKSYLAIFAISHRFREFIVQFGSASIIDEVRIGDATAEKTGLDPTDYTNFRPITNCSTISKLLERLALALLKLQIITSPNYCPLQSAYRPGHSTETELMKMMDDIYRHVDAGSAVALVALDISAAFEAVNHAILIERLKAESR